MDAENIRRVLAETVANIKSQVGRQAGSGPASYRWTTDIVKVRSIGSDHRIALSL